MSIYSFGINMDKVPEGDSFSKVAVDFRSDVEQRHTQLAIHDNDSNDLLQARAHADEIINVSGAEIRVYIRTDNTDYDRVWDTDPDPTYHNPIFMKAFFKPQPLEAELKEWGIDIANKTEIVFSHRQVFTEFGERMLRSGDVIYLVYGSPNTALSPNYYRITNVTPSGQFRYNWLYITCTIESLTSDITVRPSDAEPLPASQVVDSGGVYYENG